jgi:hypothetical protein
MVNYKVRWLLGKPFEHPFNDVLGPAFSSAAVTVSLLKKERPAKAADHWCRQHQPRGTINRRRFQKNAAVFVEWPWGWHLRQLAFFQAWFWELCRALCQNPLTNTCGNPEFAVHRRAADPGNSGDVGYLSSNPTGS